MSQIACPVVHEDSSRGKGRSCDRAPAPCRRDSPHSTRRENSLRSRLWPLLLVPVLVALTAAPAAAAPPSTDPATAADIAATWLAHQVNDQGFIPQAGNPSSPNLST